MSFPKNVANQALVLCGRRCCICHKFCGKKMELHHIKQKAHGGNDTLENCIPLCFDCHGDMGKLDPDHPKGKQYTHKELISHRDNWYEKVAATPLFQDGMEYEADKELFINICSVFSPLIRCWLTDKDLGGSHPHDVFTPFLELQYKYNDPFSEFLNVELETLKGNLLDSINQFMSYKSTNTFIQDVSGMRKLVTRQWMVNHLDWQPCNMNYEEYSKMYEQQANRLNELASSVWESFCEFARQGRRLLNM